MVEYIDELANKERELANNVRMDFLRQTPFEQFQNSYFQYSRYVNNLFVMDKHTDIVLQRQIDTLYQSRLDQEKLHRRD